MKNIIDGKLKVCITGDNMENIQRLKQVIYQQCMVHGLEVTAMDQSIKQLLFLVQSVSYFVKKDYKKDY